jgi:hypothetical protein
MSDQPEYLRRLKENQARHERSAPAQAQGQDALSLQEREAVKWAREIAGAELRAHKNLAGARYAVVLKVQSATGSTGFSLEGLASREALIERLRPGSGYGEEVVGSYEVRGGRPITVGADAEGQIKLTMGTPRPGANPMSPEQMLRKATAQAEVRAKTRPREREGKGRGGR